MSNFLERVLGIDTSMSMRLFYCPTYEYIWLEDQEEDRVYFKTTVFVHEELVLAEADLYYGPEREGNMCTFYTGCAENEGLWLWKVHHALHELDEDLELRPIPKIYESTMEKLRSYGKSDE